MRITSQAQATSGSRRKPEQASPLQRYLKQTAAGSAPGSALHTQKRLHVWHSIAAECGRQTPG